MRIDSHQHYWSLARGDYGWLTPELAPIYRDFGPDDLKPLLTKASIDRTILVQAAPTEAETHYLLDLARTEPTVAGVVGWVDFDGCGCHAAHRRAGRRQAARRPAADDAGYPRSGLDAAPDRRHRDRVHAEPRPGLRCAGETRPPSAAADAGRAPPAIVHRHRPWRQAGHRPRRLFAMGGRHGSARRTGEHRCQALGPRDGSGSQAGARPTCGATSSISSRPSEPSRVLFGSDWPVLNLAGDYAGWLAIVERAISHLQPNEIAAVMGANARRIYLSKRGRI